MLQTVFPSRTYLTTLLLGNTDRATSTSSSLGVLSTDTETPVVTKTTMSTNFLQALEIVTKLGVDTVGQNLRILAVDDIALSVHEPGRNFAVIPVELVMFLGMCRSGCGVEVYVLLTGVLDDGNDTLKLF